MRTALGAAWLSVYLLAVIAAGNDIIATQFHMSVNSVTWAVRVGLFVVPVLVFTVAKRWALSLQLRDRDKVLHGRETGLIRLLPHGEFIEVHEPLSRAQLHTLTAHEQYKPIDIGSTSDEHGVKRRPSSAERLRAKLSRSFYGDGTQVPKPTAREYEEIANEHQQ